VFSSNADVCQTDHNITNVPEDNQSMTSVLNSSSLTSISATPTRNTPQTDQSPYCTAWLNSNAMTLSGVTRRRKLWSGGISIAGSLRIETFEGSRPHSRLWVLNGFSQAGYIVC
jgi:hypothetical protein